MQRLVLDAVCMNDNNDENTTRLNVKFVALKF